MGSVKRWAVIENGVVENVILADEEFISSQGIIAIQDDQATVGNAVDENNNIIYSQPVLPPVEEPIV